MRVDLCAQGYGFVQQGHVDRLFTLVNDLFLPVIGREHRGERRHGELFLERGPPVVSGEQAGCAPHAVGKDHHAGYGYAGDLAERRAGRAVVVPYVDFCAVEALIGRAQVFLGFFGERARIPFLVHEYRVGVVSFDDISRHDVVEHIRRIDEPVSFFRKFPGVVGIPHIYRDGGVGHRRAGHILESRPDARAFAVSAHGVVQPVDVPAEFLAQGVAQGGIFDAAEHIFVRADMEVGAVEMGGYFFDERAYHVERALLVDVQKHVGKFGLGMVRAFQFGPHGDQGAGMAGGVQLGGHGDAVDLGEGDDLRDVLPRVVLWGGDAGVFFRRHPVISPVGVPRIIVQMQVQFVHLEPAHCPDVLFEHFHREIDPGHVEHDHAAAQRRIIRHCAFRYGQVRLVLRQHLQKGAGGVQEALVAVGMQFHVFSHHNLVGRRSVFQGIGQRRGEPYPRPGRGYLYPEALQLLGENGVQFVQPGGFSPRKIDVYAF